MANAPGQRDNFSGDVTLTAPSGGVVAGLLYLILDSYWVARENANVGEPFLAANPAFGAVWATKTAGAAIGIGDKVFVVAGAIRPATATGASLVLGGIGALAAAEAADTQVLIGPIAMTNNLT